MPNNPFENIAQIGLDYILPNPYQPREREDPLHVAKVAESILTQGLLQPPVGRYTSLRKCELAFGHTRLAAYKLLTQLGLHGQSDGVDLTEFPALARLLAQRISNELGDDAGQAWLYLPVNVRELSDEEMFKMGIGENLARKDLTPIEEARAMARYRDEFGKTSEQVGELFGLSGTAVRNKIRLLELPDGLKEAFAAGTLSEGSAREVLSLLGLPQRMRDDAERQYNHEINPKQIIKDATNGALASNIHERVERILREFSEDLSKAPWKHDEVILASESGAPEDMPICAGCPQRIQRGNKWICLDKTCYWKKDKAWDWRYARRAAAAVGYPPLELKWDGPTYGESHTTFYGYGGTEQDALQMAKAVKCPNLRVAHGRINTESGGLEKDGFPDARLVCQKREGYCTCHQAVKAGMDLTKPAVEIQPYSESEEIPVITEELPLAPAITMEELSEVAREARRKKKADMAACRGLLLLAADSISQGLKGSNPGALRLVLEHTSWQFKDKNLPEGKVRFAIGKLVAAGIHNPDGYQNPNPADAIGIYNRVLEKAGLGLIPDDYPVPPSGWHQADKAEEVIIHGND